MVPICLPIVSLQSPTSSPLKNSFVFIFHYLYAFGGKDSLMQVECGCPRIPKEADGSPEAGVLGSFEPCNVGSGNQIRTSARAFHAVNTEPFLPPQVLSTSRLRHVPEAPHVDGHHR